MAGKWAILGVACVLVAGASALVSSARRPLPSSWARTVCGAPSASSESPTRWAGQVSPFRTPLAEYPRPMMVRSTVHPPDRTRGDPLSWTSLNGLWEWEPDQLPAGSAPPFGKVLGRAILVPFPVESCLSGVAPNSSKGIVRRMWYRLVLNLLPGPATAPRTLLHFEAVDWQAELWANGNMIANHTGSSDRFSVDLTDAIVATSSGTTGSEWPCPHPGGGTPSHLGAPVELLLRVFDPSDEGAQPNGKQRISAISSPGGDTYTPSSGIWQPVWIEHVPASYVSGVRIGADAAGVVTADAALIQGGAPVERVMYEVLSANGKVLASASAPPGASVSMYVPSPRLWSPASPILYDLRVRAGNDTVFSYFGMRTFEVALPHQEAPGGIVRPILNGRPIFLAGWLDQSYWPDGIYTAPTDAALRSDLEAVRTFGFNTVRLHQKVNPERWYYHADQLGVLVLQDAIQKYGRATADTIPLFEADLLAMIRSRGNHPCIIQWTTFNEADCWKVFTSPGHTVADVVALARAADWQHRPVDTDSGGGANNQPQGDVNDVHSYPYPAHPQPTSRKYAMIGEYGGIGAFVDGKEWVPGKCYAYKPVSTPAEAAAVYIGMTRILLNRTATVSAAIYTQITDVELECDGFLNYDRTTKFDAAASQGVAAANQALVNSLNREIKTSLMKLS